MRSASPLRPRLLHLAALVAATLAAPLVPLGPLDALVQLVPHAHAAPAVATPAPPAPSSPTPRAGADARRMVAMTFTNLVVFENGAGYLHGFWRTLGTAGPDTPGRLQWGRGCPDISERVFLALHTAFANPDRFFLIVDKSPDPRQPGAHCLTHVELERINPPQAPPTATTPTPTTPTTPTAPPAPTTPVRTAPSAQPPPSATPKP